MATERTISGRRAEVRYLIFAAFCGVAFMLPALTWGVPLGADLDAHFRLVQPFYDELARGNIMPGWLAESNNGFGDARFRFYPPLMFYLLSGGRWLTGDWYAGLLLIFTILSVIGAVGMYMFAKRTITPGWAAAAAAIYCLMPYHAAQFYQASLLLEFTAAAFLPWVFLGLDRTMSDERLSPSSISLTAGAAAAIVLSHVPTTLTSFIGLAIFTLLLINGKRSVKRLFAATCALVLGLAISAPFWVKVIAELPWVQAGYKVTSDHYLYTNNFALSPFTPTNLNTFFASLIAGLTIGLLFPALYFIRDIIRGRKIDDRSIGRPVRAAFVVALFAVYMTTELSRPVWAAVPKLPDIQFPHRWLSIAVVAATPAIVVSLAAWTARIRDRKFRALHIIFVLPFVLSLVYGTYELVIDSDFLTRDQFLARAEANRGGRSFTDWLPPDAAELKDLAHIEGPADAVGRVIEPIEVGSHSRQFRIADGPAGSVRIRSYYYPLWKAKAVCGREEVPLATRKAEDGILMVDLPAGECTLDLSFVEPDRTRWSIAASAIGILMSFALAFFRKRSMS
ncbi:MAG: hypothetical protein KF736_02720 [Acidobacteria bacterium]|nr:hypothetical protein [Acidobacteriota bacterium]MCW5949321.1 hypothetical protein [Pyrinomonadaceae bacterium]